MRYLSISKNPFFIAWAIFEDKQFISYGKECINGIDSEERLLNIHKIASKLIEEKKPTFVLTHIINAERTKKKVLDKVYEVRTIFKLVALQNNSIYAEFETSGWEKRIISERITDRKKLNFINRGYKIQLDDTNIADAIILAEGVAWNRLQIGK